MTYPLRNGAAETVAADYARGMSQDTGWLTLNLVDGSRREFVATPEIISVTQEFARGELAHEDWYPRVESLLILSGQTPPGFFE